MLIKTHSPIGHADQFRYRQIARHGNEVWRHLVTLGGMAPSIPIGLRRTSITRSLKDPSSLHTACAEGRQDGIEAMAVSPEDARTDPTGRMKMGPGDRSRLHRIQLSVHAIGEPCPVRRSVVALSDSAVADAGDP